MQSCVYRLMCSWLILSVLFFTTNFDLLYLKMSEDNLSFPDSLEYIVCQQWKLLFASPIIDISLTIMGERWFYLFCIHRDLISPLRVLSGSKQHNLSLVSVIFAQLFFTVVACISIPSRSMLITSFLNNLSVQQLRDDDNTLPNFIQQLIIIHIQGPIYLKSSCNEVHFWLPFQTSIELLNSWHNWLTEVEESKRKNVALRFNDGQFIYCIVFLLSLEIKYEFS